MCVWWVVEGVSIGGKSSTHESRVEVDRSLGKERLSPGDALRSRTGGESVFRRSRCFRASFSR
jgi:hypothetical protein